MCSKDGGNVCKRQLEVSDVTLVLRVFSVRDGSRDLVTLVNGLMG